MEALLDPPSKRRKYAPAEAGRVERRTSQAPADTGLDLHASEMLSEPVPARRAARRTAGTIRSRRSRPARYYGRQPATPTMRYSNAAAAAAASQASDGYKPREERSWEDFHPDLHIDMSLPIFTADEVDGRLGKTDFKSLLVQQSSIDSVIDSTPVMTEKGENQDMEEIGESSATMASPMKRKPGRPPRRPESMLSGLGSPPAPRILPLPTHNPKERLNLPKPSYRDNNHFLQYEEDQKENKVNYVDRGMANVGYQESDRFELPAKVLVRHSEAALVEDEAEVALRLESDGPSEVATALQVVGRVEYDMDEQDVEWLEDINTQRKSEGLDPIKPSVFEITMTQIEKEYHALEKRIPKPQPRHAQMNRPRSSSQAAVNGDPNPLAEEPDSKCFICDDGDCENANAIIFCDGCDLAVHQECYGVPFIPEGQWFCRKCKEIGRGTPTCIFCPNVDGAFKQTNTLRWSHLLCAIWIPEVTIANITFMEPITDVDKVPKSRWKLQCYICNQKMGACIQCGNKNCYQAFHVTCARKAKLFLKMKSQHQQGIDQTALKAFCDKHVPPEWRRIHDTDHAIVEAKRWYRHAMRDRRWADSQTAALELGAPAAPDGGVVESAEADDTIAVTKRRRNQPQQMSWRLPSGAPVVPAVVYSAVEMSLTRFTVRKRKEFVEKACRYWTLKREARRGAALLKRLQLQLESFSSMEITRRNFAGMGAAGRPRLIRRIEFAELLEKDMGHLTQICAQVREQEELRLTELQLLKDLVDTMYFPISALLVPIMQRARKLDEKTRFFKTGFDELSLQVRERYYTSVAEFSHRISQIVVERVSSSNANDTKRTLVQSENPEAGPTAIAVADHEVHPQEQKEIQKLAKRILKAMKEPLEQAARKEAELKGNELEEAVRKVDSLGMFAGVKFTDADDTPIKGTGRLRSVSEISATAGASLGNEDIDMPDVDQPVDTVVCLKPAGKKDALPVLSKKQKKSTPSSSGSSSNGQVTGSSVDEQPPTEPLSPPLSTASAHAPDQPGDADVFADGGVPWYLTPFDPEGTTVYAERYTGRAVLREMSEELSDMDDETLTELAVNGIGETPSAKGSTRTRSHAAAESVAEIAQEHGSKKKPKKKGRSNQWSRPRRVR